MIYFWYGLDLSPSLMDLILSFLILQSGFKSVHFFVGFRPEAFGPDSEFWITPNPGNR